MSFQVQSLGLSDARRLIAAGEKKTLELGIPYNIAVVDAGVVGAIGASGGSVGNDIKVAQAALVAYDCGS